MFNLVKYRYIFLLISLIVIVPGVISLAFKGLNVGIDFASGSNVELHPQTPLKISDVQRLLKPLGLSSLEVTVGNNAQLVGNKTVWIRLNTRIDTNVSNVIQSDLTNKYGSVNVKPYDIQLAGKPVTLIVVDGFSSAPSTSDIQTLLAKLPNTSDPSKGPATTATPTAVSTPATSGTPKAGTPTPIISRATPTAATTNSNPAIIPVSVTDIQAGTTDQTINILTRSSIQTTNTGGSNTTDKGTDVPTLLATILNNGGPYTALVSNSEVGGAVAQQTTLYAFLAVIVSSLAILGYIWFSFRKVSKPWRYGTCAIIALLHDVLVVLGVFSILGWLFNIQIDALFITALLTIVGFSVHDTIVVFDRIRENMQRRTSETFEQVVNASLVQTMARSLNTSLTVLFTLSALTLFGGESIRTFTLTLLIGIFSGTYSSIFNASMLLVIWEKGELGLNRFNNERTPDGRPVRELVGTR